jgi:RNA polymerase sigma-70 factor, ECF subfamily
MLGEELIRQKSYFFKLAYNLLGEVQEAEDIVQDVWLKCLEMPGATIQTPKNYIARMVVNQAIDRLKQLQKQRTLYKGTWLPEPYQEANELETSDNYTPDFALLFLMEKLNPYERAVFILREIFGLDYAEISQITELKPENCRQILHRTKEKLPQAPPKYAPDIAQQQNLLAAFVQACAKQDLAQLTAILREDIVVYSDGGGKVSAALKPLAGIDKVLRHFLGLMKLREDEALSVRWIELNKAPSALIIKDLTQTIDSIIQLTVSDNQIQRIFVLRNPDKIHFNNQISN